MWGEDRYFFRGEGGEKKRSVMGGSRAPQHYSAQRGGRKEVSGFGGGTKVFRCVLFVIEERGKKKKKKKKGKRPLLKGVLIF